MDAFVWSTKDVLFWFLLLVVVESRGACQVGMGQVDKTRKL